MWWRSAQAWPSRLWLRHRLTGSAQKVALTQAGGLTQATWHLASGRYELYCSLAGHARLGMRAFLTVR